MLLFFFINYILIKFILKDLFYKFLADYLPKLFVFNIRGNNFFENILFNFRKFNISYFINLSNTFNFYLYRNYYNRVVLFVFLIFVLFWDFILIKNI